MAKDGTARGGARIGSGQKKRDLADRVLEGRGELKTLNLPEPYDVEGAEMPSPKDYLSVRQQVIKRDGTEIILDFQAPEIYAETWQWLRKRGCDQLVNPQLISNYAMSVARWIQCELAVSQLGFLSKHPTTQMPTQSPFVAMAQSYMKQANTTWFLINQVVREGCSTSYTDTSPQDNTMEMLLSIKQSFN